MTPNKHLTHLALSLALHDANAPACEWMAIKKAAEFAPTQTAPKEEGKETINKVSISQNKN